MFNITNEDWDKIFKIRDAFSLKLRGKPLFKSQQRFSNMIIKSVIEQRGHTLLSQWTRQRGKTTVVVDTIAFLINFYFPLCKQFNIPTTPFFNVGIFAPQDEQAKTDYKLLRDTLDVLDEMGVKYSYIEKSSNTIHIARGKYPPRMIFAYTASPTSHPESKTLNLIILEESQDLIDQQIDKAIIPMGAATNATEVWIGVSGYQKCRFWELRQKLDKEQQCIVTYEEALEENKQLYAETKDQFYLNYQKHINKRIRELGVESDEFKTQYAMEWVLERGQFITYEDIIKLEAKYAIKENYPKYLSIWGGIDWGKMHDGTVFTVVDNAGKIIGWHYWQGDDYSSQINEIVFLIESKYKGLKCIWCDATGNQDMGVDSLRAKLKEKQHACRVEAFKFTAQSKDYMFKNLSRLMKDTIVDDKIVAPSFIKIPDYDTMTQGGIDHVNKDRFIKQFTDLQKEIKDNKWKCCHPDGPNYHDDYCDSLGLACLAFDIRSSSYKPVVG